jgi:hypothetical protein
MDRISQQHLPYLNGIRGLPDGRGDVENNK